MVLLLNFLSLFLVGIPVLIESKLFPIEFRVPLAGHIPDPGDVWPKPQTIHTTTTQYSLNPSMFRFTSNLESCVVIHQALQRYKNLIFIDHGFKQKPGLTLIDQVNVQVTDANCGYPQHGEDEQYTILLPLAGKSHQGQIEAKTVWGALRGLETFSQLVHSDEHNQLILNETHVEDHPRYKYRGLLLDTARHYLPKKIILDNLDAMSYNKFNAFHWHLVDDQSFPFVSTKYPTIHEKGAYTPSAIYTPKDVQEIIEYARMRGIRVIPELDTPGHTHAMARAFPDLLTPCFKDGKAFQPNFPDNSETEILNPMREETFTFMKDLFAEFKQVFKDEFIHLGMDEVFYACWKTNPNITEFMKNHSMTEHHQLEEYYVRKTLINVKDVGYKYIIWQDPVDNGVTLSNDSIVAVWKDVNLDKNMDLWQNYISRVAKKKYQIILSACWYLNYINYPYPGYDWEKYYQCDPRNFTGSKAEKDLVIGGQANIWGEFADQTNIVSRLWPRASAVAERLWSDPAQTKDVDTARHRLDLQRCRMLRRGISAAPILNGYCGDWEVGLGTKAESTSSAIDNFNRMSIIPSVILLIIFYFV